jgi:hypothetical protein
MDGITSSERQSGALVIPITGSSWPVQGEIAAASTSLPAAGKTFLTVRQVAPLRYEVGVMPPRTARWDVK